MIFTVSRSGGRRERLLAKALANLCGGVYLSRGKKKLDRLLQRGKLLGEKKIAIVGRNREGDVEIRIISLNLEELGKLTVEDFPEIKIKERYLGCKGVDLLEDEGVVEEIKIERKDKRLIFKEGEEEIFFLVVKK